MNRLVYIKAEQIARLVVQNVPATKIALKMGMSYDGVLRIMKTEEYLQIESEVRAKLLGEMDAKLMQRADIRSKMEDEMEDDAVPEAWKIVLDNLRKKRDLKTALEVLDRDPKRQFAKGAANAQAQQPAAQRPSIDSNALAQAVKDADITHGMLTKNSSQQKPAEA